MAANFNVMPAALLETKDNNIVIKYQAPIATTITSSSYSPYVFFSILI